MSYSDAVTASVLKQALHGSWIFSPPPRMLLPSLIKRQPLVERQPAMKERLRLVATQRPVIKKPVESYIGKSRLERGPSPVVRPRTNQEVKVKLTSHSRAAQRNQIMAEKLKLLEQYKTEFRVSVHRMEVMALSPTELLLKLHRKQRQ